MKKSDRIILFLILLFAFALRLFRLGMPSLWYDETVSLYLARQDLVSLTQHTAGDIHPPFYYYLLHFWGQVAGWSEFSSAFLSLFFGVILVALVYRVARDWFPPSPAQRGRVGVGVMAAFLVAVSPYNLWYSQEVRMYTLGATLGLASTYFLVRLLSRGRRTADRGQRFRDLIIYAVVTALGLYTLYYFVFLLAFQNLFALVYLIHKSQIANRKFELRFTFYSLRTWFLSQLTAFVLFLPWFPIAVRQSIDPPVPPWRSFISLPNVLLESFSALAFGQSVDPIQILPTLVIVALVIAFAFFSHQPTNALFLFTYTFIPLALIYSLSLWKPLYHVRYLFLYSPAFYILLALGITRIAQFASRITHHASRFTFYALLLFITAISAYSINNFWFNPQYADDDLRGAMHRLSEEWRPGDAILINAGYTYTTFDYYFDQPVAWRGRLSDYQKQDATNGAVVLQTGSIGADKNLGWGNPESDFYATTVDETRAALDRVFANHPRVWMLRIYDTVVDPDGIVRDYLATRGRIIDDQGFAGESFARVQGYLTSNKPSTVIPANSMRRDILFGNRIMLRTFTPETTTVRAGAPIDVNVYWQANEPTNVDNHLFIGLFAQDGRMIASNDEIPLGNALGTSRWTSDEILREPIRIFVPANTPAGNYVLRVSMYNPLTQEPLDAPSSAWVVENSQVVLTQVRVEKIK
jgi:uncharacterized membrane protein